MENKTNISEEMLEKAKKSVRINNEFEMKMTLLGVNFYDSIYQEFLKETNNEDNSIQDFINFLKKNYKCGIRLPIDPKYVKY